MLTAELTQLVMKLSYGDRAELAGILIDSLDGEDFEDEQDSISTALRRSNEIKLGLVKTITVDELWHSVNESRRR